MPSEDIKNLFSRFGSRSGRYHEIVREDQRADSVGRWPLLSSVQVGEVRDIPGVNVRLPERVEPARMVPEPSPAVRPAALSSGAAFPVSGSAVVPAPVASAPVTPAQPAGLLSRIAQSQSTTVSKPMQVAALPPSAPRKEMFSWAHEADRLAGVSAPLPVPQAATQGEASRRPMEPESPAVSPKPWLAVPAANSTPAIAVSVPDRTLQGVFGRLGGAADEAQAPAVDPRSLPAFRRLRRS